MSLTIADRVHYAARTAYCSDRMQALMDVARYVRAWRVHHAVDKVLVARLRCTLSRMRQSEAAAYYAAACGPGATPLKKREELAVVLAKCVSCGREHSSCGCPSFTAEEGQ